MGNPRILGMLHMLFTVVKSRLEPHLASMCRSCKHRYYESEVHTLRNCALCHTPLPGFERVSNLGAMN